MSDKMSFCGNSTSTVTFEVDVEHNVSYTDSTGELNAVSVSAEEVVEELDESENNTIKFTQKGTLMYGMD